MTPYSWTLKRLPLLYQQLGLLVGDPLGLKLGGCEVVQGRMNALAAIDLLQELTHAGVSVLEIPILGQVKRFLLDGLMVTRCCRSRSM